MACTETSPLLPSHSECANAGSSSRRSFMRKLRKPKETSGVDFWAASLSAKNLHRGLQCRRQCPKLLRQPMGQTTSDADGNYRIGGLAARQISVTPVAPVYVRSARAMMFGPGASRSPYRPTKPCEGHRFQISAGRGDYRSRH